jgi:hypothetical protein
MTGPGPGTPPTERFVVPRPGALQPPLAGPAALPGAIPPPRFPPAAATTFLPVVPPEPKQSRRGAVVAWMLAAAALILAVGVGAVALTVAADNRPRPPAPARPAAVPTGQSTVDAGMAGDDGTPPPRSVPAPALVDPSGAFPVHYSRQELRVQPGGGGCYPSTDSVYLDLDEPRAVSGDDAGPWDLSLIVCDAGPAVAVRTGVTASQLRPLDPTLAVNPTADPVEDPTPNDCADLVRRAPVGTDPVLIRPGLTLCVVTGAQQATSMGLPRRIAVVSVPAVAADGTISLLVSAWDAQA